MALYKSKVVERFIEEQNARLKEDDLSEEEVLEIMQKLSKLNAIRVSLSRKLDRLIL